MGRWTFLDGSLTLEFASEVDARNVLYAFVVDGEVRYVGKTVQALKRRMYGYQRPEPTQTTHIRNHARLTTELHSGRQVDLYVLPDHRLLHPGVFHLNPAAGLEDSIAHTLRPPWNLAGT